MEQKESVDANKAHNFGDGKNTLQTSTLPLFIF